MTGGSIQQTLQFVVVISIIELVVGTPVSAVVIKLGCWLYNKLVVGVYDKAGVFGTPLPFDDDSYVAGTRRRNIQMIDPGAVPTPTWGTAVTVAFCAKFVQSVVGLAVLYFLLTRTSQLGAPDSQKIGLLTIMVAGPTGFLALAWFLARFLPTTFNRGMMLGVVHFVLSVIVGSAFLLLMALFLPILNVAAGAR